ncbi:MAG: transporter substrate-binding domain-containing protein, partial [Bacteroidota bacterium]
STNEILFTITVDKKLHKSINMYILKHMKRSHFFGYLLICIALIVNLCCSQKDPSTQKFTNVQDTIPQEAAVDFEQILKRGHFTAIVDNSSTGLFLYKGQPMGFEYELLNRFAKAHGISLKVDVTPNLKEGFQKLQDGTGDILAYNLTITKERKTKIAFTDYHKLVKLVLIQRKPDGWRKMRRHQVESKLIRDPVKLIGKKISVRNSTSHIDRLQNLSDELGDDIEIIEESPDLDTEDLIEMVSKGLIDYTVAEEDIARVNSFYYPNLDVGTPLSFSQRIAWGVRKSSPGLRDTLNAWIKGMKKRVTYHVIHNKYFKNRRASIIRATSDYSSIKGGQISPYDDIIKEAAAEIGWDWTFLAAQIYKESRFNPEAVSWAGAVGLMQLLPRTAAAHGYNDLTDPGVSIKAGISHIKWISRLWEDVIEDPEERKKFILASYNIGQGHIQDAYRLAKKYDENPEKWDVVASYLLKKSKPQYYNDPVVKYGYCKGVEPVHYVEVIYDLYQKYTVLINEESENDQQPA